MKQQICNQILQPAQAQPDLPAQAKHTQKLAGLEPTQQILKQQAIHSMLINREKNL